MESPDKDEIEAIVNAIKRAIVERGYDTMIIVENYRRRRRVGFTLPEAPAWIRRRHPHHRQPGRRVGPARVMPI